MDESFLPTAKIRRLLASPLKDSHPLAEVLTLLLAQKIGDVHPPLRQRIGNLPIGELSHLAVLREIAGEDGQALGRKLFPLLSFPSLWCSEHGYHREEAHQGSRLLLQAFGKEPIHPIGESSYFRALAKMLPRMQEGASREEEIAHSFELGEGIQNAFVMLGEKVPLGAMRKGRIAIPSFGPQVHPLNDPDLFGIYRTIPHTRWAAVSAKREIWFEYFQSLQSQDLEVRFFGLTPERALSFVFYIKAEVARVDQETYLPKSLQRYCGMAKKVCFESSGDHFSIENMCPSKMEIIPLAGNGCFWDADFLLGFEIPIHDGRVVFRFCR